MPPAPTFAELMSAIFSAKESGAGVYLLLYLIILVLLSVAWVQFRINSKHMKAAIVDLMRRLDDCEKKHGEQAALREQDALARQRLQAKLSIVTGMLVSSMGNRKLPDGFWRTMIEEENFPAFDTSAQNETAPP